MCAPALAVLGSARCNPPLLHSWWSCHCHSVNRSTRVPLRRHLPARRPPDVALPALPRWRSQQGAIQATFAQCAALCCLSPCRSACLLHAGSRRERHSRSTERAVTAQLLGPNRSANETQQDGMPSCGIPSSCCSHTASGQHRSRLCLRSWCCRGCLRAATFITAAFTSTSTSTSSSSSSLRLCCRCSSSTFDWGLQWHTRQAGTCTSVDNSALPGQHTLSLQRRPMLTTNCFLPARPHNSNSTTHCYGEQLWECCQRLPRLLAQLLFRRLVQHCISQQVL